MVDKWSVGIYSASHLHEEVITAEYLEIYFARKLE